MLHRLSPSFVGLVFPQSQGANGYSRAGLAGL